MNTFKPTDILIPKKIDLTKWSVVACDQYTSEPDYWEDVREMTKEIPSTYHIVFPEIYLEDCECDCDKRIKNINDTMNVYLESDCFKTLENSFVYVERDLGNGKVRHGIIGSVDLEDYDFNKGATSYIRATEGTVLDRIPPRVKIRQNAALELPHVMLLIDDDKKTVIEPLSKCVGAMEKVYDFDLMQGSGHLTGYKLSAQEEKRIIDELTKLADKDDFNKKYNVEDKGVLLFAVGDGNHSLATAKTCWETIKKTLTDEQKQNHPARFALVEVVNIHDKSLEFEPIHRVVFDVDPEKLICDFFEYYKDKASEQDNGGQHIKYTYKGKSGDLYVKDSPFGLAVGTLGQFLDEYVLKNGGRIDYIHGDDVVEALSNEEGNIGFLLPCMGKSELFKTVITDGVLPRKTFSMGEAKEKRFYFECKKITK